MLVFKDINPVYKFTNILICSNDDICKIKSILNFKNSSENTRGRGINTDNSPTETHPPL